MSRFEQTSSHKNIVVVIGPGLKQIGGVSTFVGILLSSPYMNEKYKLLHLDISRGPRGAGLASRFAMINIVYLIRQTIKFIMINIRFQPQLMHVPITSYWAFWKNATFIIIARLMRLKIVAHLHGGMFEHYYCGSSLLVRRFIGWILNQADIVIALSNRWQRFLNEKICPDLEVVVVPNSVDDLFARSVENPIQWQSRDKNTVLFVGQLGHHKGVYDILKAIPLVVKSHSDVCFVFAGSAEKQDELTKIKNICIENDLNYRVNFLGQVTGQAKVDLFLKSTIFLLPSYGENLPYSLLEAMAAGLPVITTPVGAIPEIVEERRNGFLIQPGDHKTLAERIVQLLENDSLRIAMGEENRNRIKADFLPEKAMTLIHQIYYRVLNESLNEGNKHE